MAQPSMADRSIGSTRIRAAAVGLEDNAALCAGEFYVGEFYRKHNHGFRMRYVNGAIYATREVQAMIRASTMAGARFTAGIIPSGPRVSRLPFLLIASQVAAFVRCLTFALCVACMTSAKLVARFTSRLRLQGKI
jgi:hypothetical protein